MNEEKEIIEAETEEVKNSEPTTSSKLRNLAIAGIIAVLAFGLIGYYLWKRFPSKTEETKAGAEKNEAGRVKFLLEQQWLIRMKLAKAEKETVSRQVTSTGKVIPAANSQAVISPPVGGILSGNNLPVIGQYVGAGQTIAVIRQTATSAETAQIRAANEQVKTADAQLKTQIQAQNQQIQAQNQQIEIQNSQTKIENARLEAEKRNLNGEIEKAKIRFEQAKRESDRSSRLYEGKALSQKQLQASETDLKEARASLESINKQREALGEAKPLTPVKTIPPMRDNYPIQTNRINSDGTYAIRSPLGGYVTKVNKAIGEQVLPGEAIIEISNPDTVWVEAPIFERDLNTLGTSRTATFTVSAYPEREFKGTVLDFGSTIDEQTRAAKVIFQVENAGRALRLGMQANVRLNAEGTVSAMMIPKEAVLESEGKKLIYVLINGEEFERREVTLGDEYGEKVAVLSGINDGERVVTQGAYQIRLQELRPAENSVHSHET